MKIVGIFIKSRFYKFAFDYIKGGFLSLNFAT